MKHPGNKRLVGFAAICFFFFINLALFLSVRLSSHSFNFIFLSCALRTTKFKLLYLKFENHELHFFRVLV